MARLIFAGLAIVVGVTLAAFTPGTPGRESRSVQAQGVAVRVEARNEEPRQAKPVEREEFEAAGVCARCHVVSVLEWGISNHVKAGTNCGECHGQSRAHVANERNEIKPDRLPRGDQIARSCQRCHDVGCPETGETVSCQKCHHVHALLDPSKRPKSDDGQFDELLRSWEVFRKHMDEGDRLVRLKDWKRAKNAFQDALRLQPGNRDARVRFTLCERRLDPVFPGFDVVGDTFDSRTGLPRNVTVTGLDIPMVLIPPGEFDLGSDEIPDSQPVHTVAIAGFYLGMYEVTQAQWQALMGPNPSVHQGELFADAGRMPVEHVSWDDCQEFLKRLNERIPEGGFRLPTEAEWEYACRAEGDRPRPILPLAEFAWFRDNARRDSLDDGPSQSSSALSPRPVGTRKANAWGLHDMQGNVSEWCSSLYRPYPYDPGDGRESLDAPGMRILRGGGFADSIDGLDQALRHFDRPHRRYRWDGFRIARDVRP